jgi:hypothetical protein
MESFIIEFGNAQVLLHSSSQNIITVLKHFRSYFHEFVTEVNGINYDEISTLIIASDSNLENQLQPSWLSTREYLKWEKFGRKLAIEYKRFNHVRLLNPSSLEYNNPFSYLEPGQGIDYEQTKQIGGLVFNEIDDQTYLRIFGYALFLSIIWHLNHNSLCLHSAGVAQLKKGFLFLAESGGGKTTVAQLSAAIGYLPLGDDINFILKPDDYYRLAASVSTVISPVGYSLERPPLQGIFRLVKDTENFLVPLPPKQLVAVMFDAFLQETPYVRRLPSNLINKGFQTISDISRRVPGYELHFRKNPDFWKLIDERFPN